MAEILSRSLEETTKIAADFIENLKKFDRKKKAVIVGLHGDLGSGKTAFAKEVAKKFGVSEIVTSPTFVIEKNYKLKDRIFDHLIHIDAYRLESGQELLNLGWKEISENPGNLIFIEWPERVADILPKDMIEIDFEFVDENTRRVEIQMSKSK